MYSILVNGTQYYAGGSWRLRAGLLPSYPGYVLVTGTATVSKLVGNSVVTVGSYASNIKVPIGEENSEWGGIIVLRISDSD